jgi:acetyl esterase/lipase
MSRRLLPLLAWCWIVSSLFAQEQPRPKRLANILPVAIPEGTRTEKDVPYIPNGHERQKLDIYVPPGEGLKPVIVWVHGGGWKQGSKDRTPALGALGQGCVVVSINYRLSQHATFPAQIQDCQAAIRWLCGNAAKYQIDPDRIGVWGASAGGHLVALLGTASDTQAWEPIGEFPQQSAKVQAVVDWFGPTDFSLFGEVVARSDSSIGKLIGETNGDAKAKFRTASPVTYVTADDAPFLIMHGDKDPLVPLRQSERMVEELKAKNVEVELITYEGAGHGGAEFISDESRQRISDFFAKHLKPAAAAKP